MASTNPETFQKLLSNLSKRLFCGENELTNNILKDQLYPSLSTQDFERLVTKSISLLKAVALSDMDTKQLDAYLTSQKKRKEGGIEDWQATAFVEFWRTRKNEIKSALIESVQWHCKCKNFSWRTDTKLLSDGNIPVAILQFQVEMDKNVKNVVFETDEDQLKNLLLSMEQIQKKLEEFKE